jgi:transmembrane sensor
MSRTVPPYSVDAEAAAWVARLHGATDEGVRPALDAWVAENPAHAEAFERARETWAILPRAARYSEAEMRLLQPPPSRPWILHPAVLAASLSLMIGAGALWWSLLDGGAYATRPGEQKVATLEDGSRIALNTDTQVDVRFGADRRRIELDKGEAMFEVAHDAARPFVVIAGDTRIQAIGTVFTVRRTRDDVVVTLIKGKVAVSHQRPGARGPSAAPVVLRPGEKLTEPLAGPMRVEPESVEAATAWRRGQTVFRETPLGSAVTELNRYGGPRIVIDDPRVAALPISGVFTTNAADFAEAVATLHGLRLEKEGDALHIRR